VEIDFPTSLDPNKNKATMPSLALQIVFTKKRILGPYKEKYP